MFRRAFCIVLAAAPLLVASQDVRTQSAFGNGTTAIRRKAEKQGFPWPYFSKGGKGTAVIFTFDFGDADITILTEKKIQEDELLRIAKGLARSMGKPKADFIMRPSSGASYIDIELNDYLVKPARLQTNFDHQIGETVEYLRTAKLPEPIVLAIECDSADSVIPSEVVADGRKWEDVEFLRGDDLPSHYTVAFTITLPWIAYPIALLMPLLILGAPVGLSFLMWRAFRRHSNQQESEQEVLVEQKKPLDEVQREYMKSKAGIMIFPLLLPLLFLPFVFSRSGSKKLLEGSFELLPNWLTTCLTISMPFLIIGTLALQVVLTKRAQRIKPVEASPNPAAALIPLVGLMVVLTVVMMAAMFLPGFAQVPSTLRRLIIFGIMFVAFTWAILIYVRQANRSRTRLQSGEEWHDRTMELARKAGVKVWMVTVVDSDVVNAYATPWNTVGITRQLLVKLDKREVDAVIAHELGHHKYAHVKVMFALSLAVVAMFVLGIQKLRDILTASNAPEWVQTITLGPFPMLLFILLIQPVALGWARRRNELRADRFAADLVGDPEVMISALMKMAYENQSPTDLKRMDEFLATHPSVAKRVAALRSSSERLVSQPKET